MNLSADLKQFINDNLKQDINNLALKKNPFQDYEWSWILNQIQAKQKAEKKLPTWFGPPVWSKRIFQSVKPDEPLLKSFIMFLPYNSPRLTSNILE